MKQIIIHRKFEKDLHRDFDKLKSGILEILEFYGGIEYIILERSCIRIEGVLRINFYSGSEDKLVGLKPNYAIVDSYKAHRYLIYVRGAVLLDDIHEVLNVVRYELKNHRKKRMLNSIYGLSTTSNGYFDTDQIFYTASRQSGKTMTSYANLLKQIERNKNMNWRVKPEGRIKNVIFNDPATIIFWSDGTKTVVKAEGEPFDPEKGLAMAIAKRVLGNKGDYYNEFKKWLPEEKAKWKDPVEKVCSSCKYFSLGPSSINTCLECLKGKNLPNWEKRDD